MDGWIWNLYDGFGMVMCVAERFVRFLWAATQHAILYFTLPYYIIVITLYHISTMVLLFSNSDEFFITLILRDPPFAQLID
jgi:hypothetical protein